MCQYRSAVCDGTRKKDGRGGTSAPPAGTQVPTALGPPKAFTEAPGVGEPTAPEAERPLLPQLPQQCNPATILAHGKRIVDEELPLCSPTGLIGQLLQLSAG